MKNRFLAVFSAIILFGLCAFTYEKITLKAQPASFLKYYGSHPAHDWTGVNKKALVNVVYDSEKNSIDKVVVVGKVADFDSQNSNRDSHAMEVLEGIKYPKVTFASTAVTQSGNNLSITGLLTFHGIVKTITFNATRADKGNQLTVTGKFPVSLTEYKIERPSLMTVAMNDKVDIEFSTVLVKP